MKLPKDSPIKYLKPDALHQQIQQLTKGMRVTKGTFEMLIDNCTLEDMEWNHMDQMHRPSIHNTYEAGARIAVGNDFAISLTKWSRWPFLITVTDVFVDRGLFYQSMVLGGVIFLHLIISFEEIGDKVQLKLNWFIASHWLFKLLHKPLSKKLYQLNTRLQEEDAQIRHGRFALRKKGYHFKTDQPNYYNSNKLTNNTIYPPIDNDSSISLENIKSEITQVKAGNLEFLVKQENNEYHIWPAACPHEGGPLAKGNFCESQIVCPWHSLRFSPVKLSASLIEGSRYGFSYKLNQDKIYVSQTMAMSCKKLEMDLSI